MMIGLSAVAVGAMAAALAAGSEGTSDYRIDGAVYAVPHAYDVQSQGPGFPQLPGMDSEPADQVRLQFPAAELARDIPGYSATFHGYNGEVPADMRVQIMGGREAREFGDDVKTVWQQMKPFEAASGREPDPLTGWDRVYSMKGDPGTLAEGSGIFYLVPTADKPMPDNWRLPHCKASPDAEHRPRVDCTFTISRNGLTYDFMLRQENLVLAGQVAAYVETRLRSWKHN